MRGNAHGLIDYNDVGILEDDVHTVHSFGGNIGDVAHLGKRHRELLALAHAFRASGDLTVDEDVARLHEVRDLRAREPQEAGKSDVDALPFEPTGDEEESLATHSLASIFSPASNGALTRVRMTSRTAPLVTAMSATLKIGQCGSSRKSTT